MDESGNPVSAAQVSWRDMDGLKRTVEVHTGVEPTAETDRGGHFVIRGLKATHRYKLYAQKEEAGYPDMSLSFFNPKDVAVVGTPTVQENAANHPDSMLRIGPKAHVFMYRVFDGTTGKPIENVTLSMERTDEGSVSGGGCADNRCLLPPDSDVRIEFSATGYKSWYYPSTLSKAESSALHTSPGELTELDVALQPE